MAIYEIIMLIFFNTSFNIENKNEKHVKNAYKIQYAGSEGFLSAGYLLKIKKKFELSASYGYTPKFAGGHLHTFNLKISFNLKNFQLGETINISPVLIGSFINMTFNENLSVKWADYYPPDYYWWQRNFRQYIFIGSEVSVKIKNAYLDRLTFYFELNSNDLYLLSYFSNLKSLNPYDILFFGAGIKFFRK